MERIELSPISEHRFVAIELATKKEEVTVTTSEAILTDSSGGRYLPIGVAPFSISSFIAFKTETQSGMVSGYSTTSMGEASVRVGRKEESDPFEVKVRGAGAKFLLVYEVPKDSSGFKLALGDSKPLTVPLQTE